MPLSLAAARGGFSRPGLASRMRADAAGPAERRLENAAAAAGGRMR